MGRKLQQKFVATQFFVNAINDFSRENGPGWRIAMAIGLHPSTYSRIVSRKRLDRFEIEGTVLIARQIGFTGECCCPVDDI